MSLWTSGDAATRSTTAARVGAGSWLELDDDYGRGTDGAGSPDGRVLGTTLHGLFELGRVPGRLPDEVAHRRGKPFSPSGVSFAAAREAQLDRLADLVEAHLDTRRHRSPDQGSPDVDPRSSPPPTPRSWPCARSSTPPRRLPGGAGGQPHHAGRPLPTSTGSRSWSCRLLGGRRAWEGRLRRAARRCLRRRAFRCCLRRRVHARPRAHRRLHRGRPGRRRGLRLPGPRRAGQPEPTCCASSPGSRLGPPEPSPRRTASWAPIWNPSTQPSRRSACCLLPGPPPRREHQLRRRPVRRHPGRGAPTPWPCWCYSLRPDAGAVPVLSPVVAGGPTCGDHRAGHGRPRRRRQLDACRPGASRRARGPGDGRHHDPKRLGGQRPPACRRSTWPWAWPSPSSTAGSSGARSRSRRWSTTATSWAPRSPPTAPSPTGWRGWPAWPPAWPGCATPPRRQARRPRPVRLPDQAQPARQRRRPRHPGVGARPARRPAGRRLPGRPHPGERRRAHGRAGRRRSPTRGDPHPGPARPGRGPHRRVRLQRLVRRRCPTSCASSGSPLGTAARRRLRRPSGQLGLLAGLDLGGVLVAIQPPRGFGDDPIAVYHSPDLPPTHHYLAFYRWLDEAGAPTPSSTWASTAPWSGCRARASASRPPARPTPPSATCPSSTPSSSTTRARAPRPSAGPTPWSSTTCCRP